MNAKKPLTQNEIRAALWHRGVLSYKLHPAQKELYDLYYRSSNKTNTWLLGRRCLGKGTLIKTPIGLVEIEKLKVGDSVYGVNKDGTVTPCEIVKTHVNGIKPVIDLVHHNKLLETCTEDHKWLTTHETLGGEEELETRNITRRQRIIRKWIDAPGGRVVEPHAYVLGAFLGDGCRSESQIPERNKRLFISSIDDLIPRKIAEILGCNFYRQNPNNYTWVLRSKDKSKLSFNRYKKYCHHRRSYEKFIDLDIIKKWCRSSQLQFLAGLIDTDGTVQVSEGCLIVGFGMQSRSVVEAASYIIHNNFQYRPTIYCDSREKYKNGPVYYFNIKNNLYCKKILKSLDSYLVRPSKKYKPEYDSFLENNTNPTSIGVKKINPRLLETFDITINNETNLYLTANGLVTHNSGKSYCLVVLSVEECLKKPNSVVKLVSPTKTQMEQNIKPLFNKVLEDCPISLEPKFSAKNSTYKFKNGSEIQLAGSDGGHAEKLRGTDCTAAFIDEAGSCDELGSLVRDILLPATLATKGKIVLASTPPKDMDHEFVRFIEEAEKNETIVKKPTTCNPLIPADELERLINELGGYDSETTRREIFCELIRSSVTTVIPEFTEQLEALIVQDVQRPPFFDSYEAMDLGFVDLTGILFAYYDFKNARIVIEDELLVNLKQSETNLPKLVSLIQEKERSLWYVPQTGEIRPVFLRVSDLNPIALQEILRASNFQLNFANARKDDKDAAINQLRVAIANKKIIINPRCKNLIIQLRHAKWKVRGSKREFKRSTDNGHYDLIDALIYLVRSVNYNKNPYPSHYNMDPKDLYVRKDISKPQQLSPDMNVFKALFQPKRPTGPKKF